MFTLCVMYVAQGIPWGFTAITLPAILGARKLDAEAIGGVMAMTTLPYTFKWAWGFLIDAFPSKRFGRRRPWIIFAQGMMAATIGVMIVIPNLVESISLLTWLVFVNTVFSSMQDVAVDALAVDLLDEKERGRANGMMYASKWGGGFLGGWGLSHVISACGLRTGLIVQTLALFAIMAVPLLVRERAGSDQARAMPIWESIPAWWRRTFADDFGGVIWAGIKNRAVQSAALGALVMVLSNLGVAILAAFATVLYTQQLDWTSEDYASLLGGPALIAGLLGSLAGGFIADFVGHRRLAALATILLAGFYLAWSLLEPHWGSKQFVYSLFWIEPFLIGILTVSLFALCMDISWTAIAASQFAIYMALSNFSSTTGYKLAGHMAGWFTNAGVYQVAALCQISFVLVLPFIDPRAARRTAAT
jgi:MFS transporter, PAT family, beta-lactamase induction signal transducer AmpG